MKLRALPPQPLPPFPRSLNTPPDILDEGAWPRQPAAEDWEQAGGEKRRIEGGARRRRRRLRYRRERIQAGEINQEVNSRQGCLVFGEDPLVVVGEGGGWGGRGDIGKDE